jgi:hypothetical protein
MSVKMKLATAPPLMIVGCSSAGRSLPAIVRLRPFRLSQISRLRHAQPRDGSLGQGFEKLYPDVKVEIENNRLGDGPALLEAVPIRPDVATNDCRRNRRVQGKYGSKSQLRVAVDALRFT